MAHERKTFAHHIAHSALLFGAVISLSLVAISPFISYKVALAECAGDQFQFDDGIKTIFDCENKMTFVQQTDKITYRGSETNDIVFTKAPSTKSAETDATLITYSVVPPCTNSYAPCDTAMVGKRSKQTDSRPIKVMKDTGSIVTQNDTYRYDNDPTTNDKNGIIQSGSLVFRQSEENNKVYIYTYSNPVANPCKLTITVTKVGGADGTINGTSPIQTTSGVYGGAAQYSCQTTYTNQAIKIAADKDSKTNQDAAVEKTQTPAKEEPKSCFSGIPSFGWFLCPFLGIADKVNEFAKEKVSDILYISSDVRNDSKLESSWRIMRNLSSALLVLVALFMIAGQIFSFDFMSAYTVKKVLPRLVIAAILIQLSWFIFTTMIALMNSLGVGLYSLLTYPFTQGGNGTILDLVGTVQNNSKMASAFTGTAVFAGLTTGAVVGAIAITSGGALLTFVVAAIGVIISLLGTLFTLIVRKSLILILLVLAPLALVAWILPGTQRYWDMWWKLFSKLLLMYPLIMLLFAAGTIGASITANQQDPGAFDLIIVVVMFFAPLFLIPATFKFAGGLFTKIGSAVDKTSSKAKNSGMFGLRDQAKADKEYANAKKDQRAQQLLGKHYSGDDVSKKDLFLARRRTKTFNMGLGSSARGDFGKRAYQVAQAGIRDIDKESTENAQTEFKNAYETVSSSDRRDFVIGLHSAKLGEKFHIRDKTTGQIKQSFTATAAMKIGGAESAVVFKQQDKLKISIEEIRTKGDADSRRLLERTLSQPVFDERMTDYIRGETIGTADGNAAVYNAMLTKYDKMDDVKGGTKEKLRLQTALQGSLEIKADRLSRVAANADNHEEDFEAFAKTFRENGQGTITKETMLAVQQSKGGLVLRHDAAKNEYVAVSASSVASTTP